MKRWTPAVSLDSNSNAAVDSNVRSADQTPGAISPTRRMLERATAATLVRLHVRSRTRVTLRLV
jgi:hypothetical protein